MFSRSTQWSVARVLLILLALIPVVMFLLVIVNLIHNSLLAVSEVGLANLFSQKISTVYSGQYIPGQYGLLTAIWRTVLLAAVSICIAFPVSLILAIVASDFSMGWMSRPIELLLSIFSGLPPIIYALLSVFILKNFFLPKFTGQDLVESLIQTLPGLPPWNAGMLPISQSTLLGGILLALIVIPFMAPLILDAIRNVPPEQREASLALGATRWFTLWRIVIPWAAPGIIAAVSLGILKTVGDVVISAWTIGLVKDNGLPVPLVDIFERNAPLTSTGAGIVGGFFGTGASPGINSYVANFAALLLLIFAFFVIGLAGLIRRWLTRRLAL